MFFGPNSHSFSSVKPFKKQPQCTFRSLWAAGGRIFRFSVLLRRFFSVKSWDFLPSWWGTGSWWTTTKHEDVYTYVCDFFLPPPAGRCGRGHDWNNDKLQLMYVCESASCHGRGKVDEVCIQLGTHRYFPSAWSDSICAHLINTEEKKTGGILQVFERKQSHVAVLSSGLQEDSFPSGAQRATLTEGPRPIFTLWLRDLMPWWKNKSKPECLMECKPGGRLWLLQLFSCPD